jgi:hypothetical protein
MKPRSALAAGMFALAVTVGILPAHGATVTDFIQFSSSGSFPVNFPSGPNDLDYFFQPGTTVTGSFDITFDPTQLYLPGTSVAGVISNVSLFVTDPFFNVANFIDLNPIASFAYDPVTLTLDSSVTGAGSKAMTTTADVTLGFNLHGSTADFEIWYSQPEFGDTLTSSGSASVAPTPLPSTWTLLIGGFAGLFWFAFRGTKDNHSAITTI